MVVGTAITDITWVTAQYAERIHAAYADRYPSEK